MPWTDFFAKLLEKQTVLLMLTGIGLVLFAATNGYAPWHLSIVYPIWQWIIGGIGILCVGIAALSFALGISRHPTTTQLKKKFRIAINSHQKGQSVSTPVRLWGTYTSQPPEKNIFVFEHDPETRLYWAKGKLSFDSSDHTWQATVHLGPGDNKERILIIAFGGENTLKMISYHRRLTACNCWEGMEEMPADFHDLAHVQIVLRCPFNA
jgi:hypothetical protein